MTVPNNTDKDGARENGRDEISNPSFPLAVQTNRAWREQALTRVAEMRTLAACFVDDENFRQPTPPGNSGDGPPREALRQRNSNLNEAINGHLNEASGAAKGKTGVRNWARNGAIIERAMSNLDAAEADLLRRAPKAYLRGQMPHLWAHVRQHLPAKDPRRIRMQALVDVAAMGDLDECAKETIIQAVRVASSEARREFTRVRSFRNLVLISTGLMTAITAVVAFLGWKQPELITLCFPPQAPNPPACPTGDTPHPVDLLLVQFVGLVAASVSGAASIHRVSGSDTRLGLLSALALLKLPTGALTAFLGLMLMRGGFIPGLSALDTPAQILAWAALFGAAQQLVTGLIDKQADHVLSQVAGKADPGPGQ
jgi:hypothetical protein